MIEIVLGKNRVCCMGYTLKNELKPNIPLRKERLPFFLFHVNPGGIYEQSC